MIGKGPGGRPPGSKNKVGSLGAQAAREMIKKALSEERELFLWGYWLDHKDNRISWEAFKLAMAYKYGHPYQPVAPVDEQEAVIILGDGRVGIQAVSETERVPQLPS